MILGWSNFCAIGSLLAVLLAINLCAGDPMFALGVLPNFKSP